MLIYIETGKIDPHPDNPRKDLGDLTELAESIKINGILQNLTVVPWFSELTRAPADDSAMNGHYRAVIGHRRLAAAKLAGLKEVPCVVSDMGPRDQVATMLLENMQRNDLTIYEQASGFQMMLNFGETINDIAGKTGFSETTVRRRVKLLELDQNKFKESINRGATLQDYAELEKIKDIKIRNKVLEKIGTPNFKWEVQNAIDKEAKEKIMALIVAEVEKFATQIKNTNGMKWFKSYYPSQDSHVEVPEDADSTEYFFNVAEYGYITIYTKLEQVQPQIDAARIEKQKEIQERLQELNRISKQAYELRGKFIRDYSNGQAKKHMDTILEFTIKAMLDDDYGRGADYEDVAKFVDLKINEDYEYSDLVNCVNSCFNGQLEKYLVIASYLVLEYKDARYYSFQTAQHNDNQYLNLVNDFLVALGHEMSDEECTLRDGTHKLFMSDAGNK